MVEFFLVAVKRLLKAGAVMMPDMTPWSYPKRTNPRPVLEQEQERRRHSVLGCTSRCNSGNSQGKRPASEAHKLWGSHDREEVLSRIFLI